MSDNATIDKHLDSVLRASGSGLRHYSMQKTLDDMRAAMRQAMRIEPNWAPAGGYKDLPDGNWLVLLEKADGNSRVQVAHKTGLFVTVGHAFAFDVPKIIGYMPLPAHEEIV